MTGSTHPEERFAVHELAWDTRFFGVKMGRLCLTSRSGGEAADGPIVTRALETARSEGYAFVLCEIDAGNVPLLNQALAHGGIVGDALVTFTHELNEADGLGSGSLTHRPERAAAADETDVIRISRDSFQYSRFYQDSRFRRVDVDRLYEQWVRSTFAEEEYWVIREGTRTVAFISLLHDAPRAESRIRLIAVDPDFQGRGLGNQLVAGAMERARVTGSKTLLVGTQLGNRPAIRLYERHQFRLSEAIFRLHVWI